VSASRKEYPASQPFPAPAGPEKPNGVAAAHAASPPLELEAAPLTQPPPGRHSNPLLMPIVASLITAVVVFGVFTVVLLFLGPKKGRPEAVFLAREEATRARDPQPKPNIDQANNKPVEPDRVIPKPDKVVPKPDEEKKPADKPEEKPKEDPLAAGLTFEKDVLPIFKTKCVGCHGVAKKKGGVDVRTVQALLKGGDEGPCLVPGSTAKSPLWEVLQSNRMPPGKTKLTAAEKETIRKWIAGGAKDGRSAAAQ
jgi:hypothetical protein